jgi:hypothetical protein
MTKSLVNRAHAAVMIATGPVRRSCWTRARRDTVTSPASGADGTSPISKPARGRRSARSTRHRTSKNTARTSGPRSRATWTQWRMPPLRSSSRSTPACWEPWIVHSSRRLIDPGVGSPRPRLPHGRSPLSMRRARRGHPVLRLPGMAAGGMSVPGNPATVIGVRGAPNPKRLRSGRR